MIHLAEKLLAEGLAALARGWAVTPLNGKRPLLEGWPQAPRPTELQVRSWVAAGRNLGLRTGPVSGVLAIDHDPRNEDGSPLPALPTTVTARTGGGGSHYLCACPDDPPPNSSGLVHPAIDIKSAGGQVVLAGSIHPDTGMPYAWAAGLDPDSVPLARVPEALLAKMRKPAPMAPAVRRIPHDLRPDHAERVTRARAWLAKVPRAISGQGGHDRTFYVACRLALGFDLDEGTALALLSEWNQSCEPPWSEREMLHKVADALKQPGERGYMLLARGHADTAPLWAAVALSRGHEARVVLPRRVSRRTLRLLNTGEDRRYANASGSVDGSRAVFAAAMSLLAAGLPEQAVADAIASSALRQHIDSHGAESALWLAQTITAARRALEQPPRRRS